MRLLDAAWMVLIGVGAVVLALCGIARTVTDRQGSDFLDSGAGWMPFHLVCGAAIFAFIAGVALLLVNRRS